MCGKLSRCGLIRVTLRSICVASTRCHRCIHKSWLLPPSLAANDTLKYWPTISNEVEAGPMNRPGDNEHNSEEITHWVQYEIRQVAHTRHPSCICTVSAGWPGLCMGVRPPGGGGSSRVAARAPSLHRPAVYPEDTYKPSMPRRYIQVRSLFHSQGSLLLGGHIRGILEIMLTRANP